MMGSRRNWACVLAAVLALGVAGCMEESPELMMGQNGQPPPAPGPNQGGPEGGQPGAPQGGQVVNPQQAGNPDGAPAGVPTGQAGAAKESQKLPAGEQAPGGTTASDQASGDTTGETGQAGRADGAETGSEGSAQVAGATGQAASKAPVGSGPPPPEAGSSDSKPGLLATLFSSQSSSSSSAPAGTTLVQPANAGSPGLPRVLDTVEDKPLYALSDLEASPEVVRLKGTVSCSVCKDKIVLNVVSAKGLVVSAPGLAPGPFDIPMPRGLGEVTVTAIGDDNGDGLPTKGEPLGGYMKNPVEVGEADIDGVTIEIGKSLPPPAAEQK